MLKKIVTACSNVMQIRIPAPDKRAKVYIGIASAAILLWFLTIGYYCFYREHCYKELLQSPDAEVRAKTIGKIRGRYFMSLMLNDVANLANDSSPEVRRRVIGFLGYFNQQYTDKANLSTLYLLSEMILDKDKANRSFATNQLEIAVLYYTCDFEVQKREETKYHIGLIQNLILAFQQNMADSEFYNSFLVSDSLSMISGNENFKISSDSDLKKYLAIYLDWFYKEVLDLPLPS